MSTKPPSEKPYPELAVIECKACGRCVHACPKDVLFIGKKLNQRGYTHVEYTGEGCIGCGNCFLACPEPHTIKVHTGHKA